MAQRVAKFLPKIIVHDIFKRKPFSKYRNSETIRTILINRLLMAIVKLSTLAAGESGVIAALHAEDELYHRLAAMGFRIGKRVEILRLGRFSGPLHLRIGATDLMLRRNDANKIDVAAE